MSSLLSNKSTELVFGLIDNYYQDVHSGPQQPQTADLLGNLGPSSGGHSTMGSLGALVAAADMRSSSAADMDIVARANAVAADDGRRLEELFALLTAAQSQASATAGISRDQLQRLDLELGEIRSLLVELKTIQRGLHTEANSSALTQKLAALAHWQECVLNNALVARMRMHTGSSSVCTTADQYIELSQAQRLEPPQFHPHAPPHPAHVNATQQTRPVFAAAAPPPHYVYPHAQAFAHAAPQPKPAYGRSGFIVPRQFSMDNQIDMHGGGANAHDARKARNSHKG